MIAVDTNILVAFHRTEYAHHEEAVRLITGLAEGPSAWAIPWPCIHEFLAVVTHPRIFKKPSPMSDALDVVAALLESPTLCLLQEGVTYWARLSKLLISGKAAGPRVHDGRVAALCLDHGVRELWTLDRDFSRFPELITRNPLIRSKG